MLQFGYMKKQKGFIIPLLVVGILVIAGGVYLYVRNDTASDSVGWTKEINSEYDYQISYPPKAILNSFKIDPEVTVEDNMKTLACKDAKSTLGARIITVADGESFWQTPVVINNGKILSTYATVKNSFCFLITFKIGDQNSFIDSVETRNAIEVTKQIVSSFKIKLKDLSN